MKRAVLWFGLSVAVLAGCSKDTGPGVEPSGDVDPLRSSVSADREEGAIANGTDAVVLQIAARDASGSAAKARPVEVTSNISSDVIVLDATTTDGNGNASARLTATTPGSRVITVRVEGVRVTAGGNPLTVTFVPGAGNQLAFVAQPGAAQVGVPLTPAIKVEILDSLGNRTHGSDEITLEDESAEISETVAAVNGVATFPNFRFRTPGSHHLVASGEGLAGVTSESFEVTTGAPARLTIEEQPLNAVDAGQPIRLKVAVRDSEGNVVKEGPGAMTTVAVRLFSNPSGVALEGVLTANAVAGIASFDDVRVRKNSSGYSLIAFTPLASYQSAESTTFEVKPSAPVQATSKFSVAPVVAEANGEKPVSIQIRLADAFGNPVAGQAVQLRATGTGNAFAPSPNLVTDASGAIVASLVSTVAEEKTITAEVVGDGLFTMTRVVEFVSGSVNEGLSTFTASKATATADGTDSITFRLLLRDASGNAIIGQPAAINTTGSGNTWSGIGTSGTTGEDGSLEFTLSSTKAEAKLVTLVSGGHNFTQTVTFHPGTAVQGMSRVVSGAQSRTVGTDVTTPLKVFVADAKGNPIAGVPVTFTVQTGGSFPPNGASSVEVPTDALGNAETGYTMGTEARTSSDVVLVTAPPDLRFTITLSALVGLPATMNLYPATRITRANAGFTFLSNNPDRIGVQVLDQYGNPVPSVPIVFSVQSQPEGTGTGVPAAINNLATATVLTAAATSSTPGIALPNTLKLHNRLGDNVFKMECTNPTSCGAILSTTAQPRVETFTITGELGPASQIVHVSGSGQTGRAGETLTNPLVARVTDQAGNPIRGNVVTFAPLEGASVVGSTTATSDDDGLVQAQLRLGGTLGANRTVMRASANGVTNALNFLATVQAGDPTTLEATTTTDNQTGTVALALGRAFEVTLKDAGGNPVSGRPVVFAVASGGGFFGTRGTTTTTVNTAATTGRAAATLTLGDIAGENTVTATFGTGPGALTYTFRATANPGNPAQVSAPAGFSPVTTGTVGRAIGQAYVVEVKDTQGNLVRNRAAAVTFSVTGGNGVAISPAGAVATDGNGLASTTITQLGTRVGTYTVSATAGAGRVDYPVTATAGAASTVVVDSGNSQTAQVNTALPNPIVAKVTDQYGNPVANVPVTFEIIAGGGSLSPATVDTDTGGLARTTWTLGPTAGRAHVVFASFPGAADDALFRATGTNGPDAIAKLAGDGQYAAPGAAFGAAAVVQVRDNLGNPAANATVNFAVTTGNATLGSATATTDSQGRAFTTVTAGASANGTVTVTATLAANPARTTSFGLHAAAFPAALCTAHGPALQSFVDPVRVAAAGVYAAGEAAEGHVVQVRFADAVPGLTAGFVTTGVALACTDGAVETLVEVYPTGVFVDGEPQLGSASVGPLELSLTDGTWEIDCLGDTSLLVGPAVGGTLPSVQVARTTATWTGGLCGYATADGTPAPLADDLSFFVSGP